MKRNKKILIVEDDVTLNKGIMLTLRQEDIDIKQAFDLEEGASILKNESIDLIILDVNLPDGNGFDFCKKTRETSQVPIIFLTACDMEVDIVTGLELGADDYITKPFSLMILRARVMAALRRQVFNNGNNVFNFGELELDFEKMNFYKKDIPINLSKTEQKLLKILITNPGQVLTREQLIDNVWSDEGEYVDENALTVTIKRLRQKIENKNDNKKYIKTVYGIGYTFLVG
ncbi:response regulator transcription factor [Romboutsia lituseburensis]|uniref:Stage 0 sporulation protein A homolog n=1 Tax=Romboutsia lituseburensis DSM 797 TaxID=1121325 RepID=A0A1G9HWP5_9FIRM|nr:response regulator transcription factor [Romboutsia lituseburensis]CEH34149.1 Regulatory protein VanR [Romboutsia lituseburensis]SDL17245.1 DNA-binding response regulator, OmpR family, contains REC and winged-helix (wHTH) domain [Romboutsia lituseburensis DSM 797]